MKNYFPRSDPISIRPFKAGRRLKSKTQQSLTSETKNKYINSKN